MIFVFPFMSHPETRRFPVNLSLEPADSSWINEETFWQVKCSFFFFFRKKSASFCPGRQDGGFCALSPLSHQSTFTADSTQMSRSVPMKAAMGWLLRRDLTFVQVSCKGTSFSIAREILFLEKKKIQRAVTRIHYEPAIACGIYDQGLSSTRILQLRGGNNTIWRPTRCFADL